MRSLGSGRMEVERSISLDTAQPETTTVSIGAPISSISSESVEMEAQLPQSPKHEAALRLQKVYKSFRTRRKLADCAVLGQLELEQSWWSLLDSAELKRSSVSFFDIEKQETAVSRWLRARTRAAKVGKGLSKNHKARKLALQHWLEAIDPRHRYGHNLHFYYQKWLHCQSREPFFYWLDVGEGKDVNVGDKCPRSKLQQQCIKYLGPMERKAYEVVAVDGRLMYKQTEEFLDTVNDSKDAKWIFVLSTAKILYVGKKKKGTFQHSSFLAGGAASAAGRLVVKNGILEAIWPHSGHYTPTKENFDDFITFLEENNVDLTDVQKCPMDEEDASICKRKPSFSYRESSSEGAHNGEWIAADVATEGSSCCIAKMADVATAKSESTDQSEAAATTESSDDDCQEGEETTFEVETVEPVSTEETKVCPSGRRLSRTWTSGAGPRISCVRDYPWELQLCALEQVNLSPRSGGGLPMEPWTPAGLSAGKDKVSSPGGVMGGGGDKVLSPRSPSGMMCGFTRAQQLFSPLRRGTSVGPNFSQA